MLATTSCNDGLGIFNGEGDCGVYISFKYDYNLKDANAFAKEVNSVAPIRRHYQMMSLRWCYSSTQENISSWRGAD